MDAAQNDAQLVVHLELDLVCMNRLPRKEKAKASQEYVKRLNKVFLGLIFDFDALSFRFETMDLSQDGWSQRKSSYSCVKILQSGAI